MCESPAGLTSLKWATVTIASIFARVYYVYTIGECGAMRKEKLLNYMLKILQIQFLTLPLCFLLTKSSTLVALFKENIGVYSFQ